MAVPFGNLARPVGSLGSGARTEHTRVCPEAHGGTLVRDVALIGHEIDDRMRGLGLEFRRVRAAQTSHVARELDGRDLEPQADAEVRHTFFSCIAGSLDFAFASARAEARRDQDAIRGVETTRAFTFDFFRVDVAQDHAAVVGDSAVHDRFVEALIGLGEVDILADQRDLDLELRAVHALDDLFPARELGRARPDVEQLRDLFVDALLVEFGGDLVDAVHVLGGKDRVGSHVGKESDLLFECGAHRPGCSA